MLPLLMRLQCVVELDSHIARIALAEGSTILIRSERRANEPVAKALQRLAKSLAAKRGNGLQPRAAQQPAAERVSAAPSAAAPLPLQLLIVSSAFRLIDAAGLSLDVQSPRKPGAPTARSRLRPSPRPVGSAGVLRAVTSLELASLIS
jgi:hypothetical protein